MDKSFRNDMLATIHPEAQKMTDRWDLLIVNIALQEIAILTRAGAAKAYWL